MPQSVDFQQTHLDRVSRSFAFCIRRLPDPLRAWVGLTYLICRILDTVEDSEWSSRERQNVAFSLIENAIKDRGACSALKGWQSDFAGLSDGEQKLIGDAHLLMEDFHDLPENVRISVRDLVLSMALGMRHFLDRQSNGRLRLATLSEVNQYCFFVAGLVGEALTNLVSSVEPSFPTSVANLLRAHHFGLFLQKVNILKDQASDEASGRMLVPSREQLQASAGMDAREALEFLCAIPNEQVEFRRFCGWSLFLGLETLVITQTNSIRRMLSKISRLETQRLLDQIDSIIMDNQRLQEFFFRRAEPLDWSFGADASSYPPSPEWVAKLYRGRLDLQSLARLGLA